MLLWSGLTADGVPLPLGGQVLVARHPGGGLARLLLGLAVEARGAGQVELHVAGDLGLSGPLGSQLSNSLL